MRIPMMTRYQLDALRELKSGSQGTNELAASYYTLRKLEQKGLVKSIKLRKSKDCRCWRLWSLTEKGAMEV